MELIIDVLLFLNCWDCLWVWPSPHTWTMILKLVHSLKGSLKYLHYFYSERATEVALSPTISWVPCALIVQILTLQRFNYRENCPIHYNHTFDYLVKDSERAGLWNAGLYISSCIDLSGNLVPKPEPKGMLCVSSLSQMLQVIDMFPFCSASNQALFQHVPAHDFRCSSMFCIFLSLLTIGLPFIWITLPTLLLHLFCVSAFYGTS